MIIVMGLAGAGKGTQAKLLAERDGYALISTGDLLRKYATDEQKKRMVTGELLEDEEIFAMIGKALDVTPDLDRCLVDGTPRSIPQSDWLLREAKRRGVTVAAVIHLDTTEDVVKGRLLARGRTDDNEEAIAKRFDEYYQTTRPILKHLAQEGVEIIHVNGDQAAEKVHTDIVKALRIHNL